MESVSSTTASTDLESVVRPILANLAEASGMESVYVTGMDWPRARQCILYAHNDGKQLVTEGVDLPWSSTLCRHSLVEGPSFTSDVQGAWPGVAAAEELDLKTFISVPVFDPDAAGAGRLLGTICAVSSDAVVLGEATRRLMRFAATEVSRQLKGWQELHLARERAETAELERAEYEALAADLGRAIEVIQRQRDELAELTREILNSSD